MTGSGRRAAVRRPGAAGAGAPQVLLLHGLGGGNLAWAPLAARVGDDWRLWEALLPWAPGGDATWSHHVPASSWVADAVRAVDGGPDVVVAHSFSATLVLELLTTAEVPPPKALVLVAPFHRARAEDFDRASVALSLAHVDAVLEEGLRAPRGDRATRASPEVVRRMGRWARERIGPYGWARFFGSYLGTPFLDLAELRTPTLVVAGEDDVAATAEQCRELTRRLPAGRVEVLAGCGHFPMTQAPVRFAEVVRGFVESTVPVAA
ncbi:alpha/beta hydrolase [Actinosynnema sp. NPDC050436]|uniref:alpha/beta fold hydrolase n=1 Tax=Actinosynnema sp. NPDC050436 TaxID=3155659 RepID=UPI0033F20B48